MIILTRGKGEGGDASLGYSGLRGGSRVILQQKRHHLSSHPFIRIHFILIKLSFLNYFELMLNCFEGRMLGVLK